MFSDDYEQEQEELQEKLLRLNEEINEQEEQAENIDRFTYLLSWERKRDIARSRNHIIEAALLK